MSDRDRQYCELLRGVVASKQQASLLGCGFLVNLLSMAAIETVLQWDDLPSALCHDEGRLNVLIATKMKIALAEAGTEIVPLTSDR